MVPEESRSNGRLTVRRVKAAFKPSSPLPLCMIGFSSLLRLKRLPDFLGNRECKSGKGQGHGMASYAPHGKLTYLFVGPGGQTSGATHLDWVVSREWVDGLGGDVGRKAAIR